MTDNLQQQIEGGGIAAGRDINISGGQVAGRDFYNVQSRERACPSAPQPEWLQPQQNDEEIVCDDDSCRMVK